MIRTAVLKARAAHGYAWLEEKGPYYGFDVRRLHLQPEIIDVADGNWCPLSHADTELPANGLTHFQTICRRLTNGRLVPGTSKRIHIPEQDLNEFLINHGFDLPDMGEYWYSRENWGTWGFDPGTDRDWNVLTQAWRNIVTAKALSGKVEVGAMPVEELR